MTADGLSSRLEKWSCKGEKRRKKGSNVFTRLISTHFSTFFPHFLLKIVVSVRYFASRTSFSHWKQKNKPVELCKWLYFLKKKNSFKFSFDQYLRKTTIKNHPYKNHYQTKKHPMRSSEITPAPFITASVNNTIQYKKRSKRKTIKKYYDKKCSWNKVGLKLDRLRANVKSLKWLISKIIFSS